MSSHEQAAGQRPHTPSAEYMAFRAAIEEYDLDRAHELAIDLLQGRIDQSLAATNRGWDEDKTLRTHTRNMRIPDPIGTIEGYVKVRDLPNPDRKYITSRPLRRDEVTRQYDISFATPASIFSAFSARWAEGDALLRNSSKAVLNEAELDGIVVFLEATKDSFLPLQAPKSKTRQLLGWLGLKSAK